MPVVDTETVLSYGMMEGNALIRAERAVYDPQSPLSPKSFRENGSSATRLAIVANEPEAFALSGSHEVFAAGRALLQNECADTVVIKCGLKGALVFTTEGVVQLPAHRTRSTFLIGSGDIFSSEFAYRWLLENEPPEQAARLASLAVAYYCQNPSVPVPGVLPQDFNPVPITVDENKKRSVYLAGPFFNLQQLWMVDEAISQLTSQGLRVFSPLHEIGIGDPVSIARQDIKALAESDGVFALLDDCDPGTLFEIGFARAINKPVTVFITAEQSTHLTMLIGSDCDVFHDFVSAICWEASR